MHSYDVFFNHGVVGTAELKQDGLYYKVFCRCKLDHTSVYRVVINNGLTEMNLGICIPNGQEYILEKRIPIKRFGRENLIFQVQDTRDNSSQKCLQLDVENPGVPISALKQMRYHKSGGINQLLYNP